MMGTKSGSPASKWQADPVSALYEHYHKDGEKVLYEYAGGRLTAAGILLWECTLKVPEPKGTFRATGKSKRAAKRAAALQACQNLFM